MQKNTTKYSYIKLMFLMSGLWVYLFGSCTIVNNTKDTNADNITPISNSPSPMVKAVRWSGTVVLSTSWLLPNVEDAYFDFDAGHKIFDQKADIYYYVSRGTAYFNLIDVINGAKAKSLGEIAPGYDGCYHVLGEMSETSGPVAKLDGYSCLLTNEGRLVQVRVERVEVLRDKGILVLTYIVWE